MREKLNVCTYVLESAENGQVARCVVGCFLGKHVMRCHACTPTFFTLCVLLCASIVLGSLDPIYGPRTNPEPGSIATLQRQLLEAVLMGDTKLLNITNLITAGADPNGCDENHMTPLHWAAIKGQRLCVELLLQRGAHTDVRDSSNRTPLHFVAIYGQGTVFPSILTGLYFAGANFNAADQSQNTPLHLAAYENQVETVEELIKYGAKLDMANLWQQRTPLGMAIQAGATEAEAALRAAGANKEYITAIGGCGAPPCRDTLARCSTPPYGDVSPDLAKLAKDAGDALNGVWGCYQNNHFMQQQPIDQPQPPGPPRAGQQLNLIQGTCVT